MGISPRNFSMYAIPRIIRILITVIKYRSLNVVYHENDNWVLIRYCYNIWTVLTTYIYASIGLTHKPYLSITGEAVKCTSCVYPNEQRHLIQNLYVVTNTNQHKTIPCTIFTFLLQSWIYLLNDDIQILH